MAIIPRALLVAAACSVALASLSGCGNKGKLKTPAEIEKQEKKKQR